MKVLLAIDGSDASMSAVAATAALPLPPGATVEVVERHPRQLRAEGAVWPNVVRVDPPTRPRADLRRRLAASARDRRSASRRGAHHRSARARRQTGDQDRRRGCAVRARTSIVMGARGLSAVRRLLLGSVSSEVVDHAPCPVLVAATREGRPRPARDRRLAIRDRCDRLHRRQRIVRRDRGSGSSAVGDPGMPWWVGVCATRRHDVDRYLRRRGGGVSERRARRSPTMRRNGSASSTCRDHRRPCTGTSCRRSWRTRQGWRRRLIVVGARNMGTMHRWLVGSVSRSVLHLADASVLIVRTGVSRVANAPRSGPCLPDHRPSRQSSRSGRLTGRIPAADEDP